MYRNSLIFFLSLIILVINFNLKSDEIYSNFIQIYGEGPLGQHIIGFNPVYYSKEDSVKIAKKEIFEFLSGMIYGYNFFYDVENNAAGKKGYFEATPRATLSEKDRNLSVSQYEESEISMRIQATYRLNEDQKNYITGYQTVAAQLSSGSSTYSFDSESWENRFKVYKNAVQNAVLNGARKDIKSRPTSIKGKLLLAESPKFSIISGEWRAKVKIHLIIDEVEY